MIRGHPRLVVSLMTWSLLCLIGSSRGEQSRAEVKGKVTDIAGASIENASVVFAREGQAINNTVKTDSYGAYAVRIDTGVYEICVTATNFYKMCRAPFAIERGSQIQFDFQLLDIAFSDPVTIAKPSHSSPFSDPYNYERESLRAVNGIQPLVLFGHSKASGASITYTGLVRHGRQLPVLYTYDLITVKAKILSYSSGDDSVQATGDIIFEDGEHTRRGSSIKIVFIDGRPVVRLFE